MLKARRLKRKIGERDIKDNEIDKKDKTIALMPQKVMLHRPQP